MTAHDDDPPTDVPDAPAPAGLSPLPDDPSEARRLVKARLVPDDQVSDDIVHRPALPGVAAVLVFDLPDRLVPVGPDRLAAMLADDPDRDVGADEGEHLTTAEDALWDEAFAHVADDEHPEIDVQEVAEGVPVMLLHSDSFFCATNALWVDRFLDVPPDGVLFAVPLRSVVLLHAIRDQAATVALPNLAMLARENHAQGEGPVSPDVFWWHEGVIARIGVTETVTDDQINLAIELPPDLADVFAAWVPQP